MANRWRSFSLSKASLTRPLSAVALIALAGGVYGLLPGSAASSTITVSLPASASTCSTQFTSQNSYNHVTSLSPPGGSNPNVYTRLNNLGTSVYRVMGQMGYDSLTTTVPSPANITAQDGYAPHNLAAWSFAGLDKALSAAPAGVPREYTPFAPPDALFTGTEYYDSSPPSTPQGALADQSYNQLAMYMEDLDFYYNTPMAASGSGGNVTYTSSSLTDSSANFTGDTGYQVTATVMDTNGFPDWVTATVTSVTNSNHTLNFSGGWSSANSGGGTLSSTTPAAGAAYNVAAPLTSSSAPAIPNSTQWATLVNFNVTTPWPRPPSVGSVQYFELFNEPEYSSYNYPRTTPPVLAPTSVTLTGVNVAGGTLTPGQTYTYELTGIDEAQRETAPSTAFNITLPAGDNAVQVSWSKSPTSSNLGLEPDAYRIYGRTAGSTQAMVVVGRDAASGLTWTDKGTVTPSGAAPSSSGATGGLQIWRSNQYVDMWNVVGHDLRQYDPNLKLTGPTQGGGDLFVGGDVNLTAVTTGPSDNSWKTSQSYIQALVAGANPKPDAVTFHNYGWYQGTSSTEAEYWSDLSSVYSNYGSDISAAKTAGIPVWIDETNIDAGSIGSQGQANSDLRAETQTGSAWLADEFIKTCNLAPDVTQLFQFADYNGDISWGLFSGANYSGNSTCVPQPSCQNVTSSEPNLEYWMMQLINKYFPPGSAVVPLSGVPSGFDAFAVQPLGSSKVEVLVVNTQQGSGNGNGSAGTVGVQLSGASATDTQEVTLDGTTGMASGPAVQDLGAQSSVTLNMNGYGVSILSFNTNASASITGDLNGDGHVNIFDLSVFLTHWQETGVGLPEDFNGDGVVNIFDLSVLLTNYGK